MNIATHYVTFVDFDTLGIGHGCDPSSFDDAVDAYSQHRDNGLDACVMRCDPPEGTKCGALIDVTADADDCIRRRLRSRGCYDWPAWLVSEPERVSA